MNVLLSTRFMQLSCNVTVLQLELVCGAKRAYETALDHECGEKLVVKYKKEEGKGALEERYLC